MTKKHWKLNRIDPDYHANHYKANRERILKRQTEYYHRTKSEAKRRMELLELFEPEEFEQKREKYLAYQRAQAAKRRQEKGQK